MFGVSFCPCLTAACQRLYDGLYSGVTEANHVRPWYRLHGRLRRVAAHPGALFAMSIHRTLITHTPIVVINTIVTLRAQQRPVGRH